VSVAWIYRNLFPIWYSWTIVHFPLSNNFFLAQSWREWIVVALRKMNNCAAISNREQITVYSCYTHVKTERENNCCLTENEQLFSYIKSRTSYCIFMLHSRQDWARKLLLLSGKWTIVQLYQVENKLLFIHVTLTSRLSEKIVVVHFSLSNNYFLAQSWRECNMNKQ
jgi:hypothetical protein